MFLLLLLITTASFSSEFSNKPQVYREVCEEHEYECFDLRFNRSLISFLQKESLIESDDTIIVDGKRIGFKTAQDLFKRIIRDFIRYAIANSLFKKTTFGQIFYYKDDIYTIILDPIAFNLPENTKLILNVSSCSNKTVYISLSLPLKNLIETMHNEVKYLQEMIEA
jgi:uncharacterized protein YaaR (DUF327 family)